VRVLLAMRRAGIPVLYRGDNHLESGSRRWRRLSRVRARWMLRQFSGYLAVGSRSREYLRAMGAPDPGIVDSPHAVDNDWFRARADEARARRAELRASCGFSETHRVVLYAGKLVAIKRPADVIDAAARIDNGAVLFVGDGRERPALEAHARARGVHTVFAGFRNQEEMPDAYVAADALMLPGRETWGLVANEALACGLPVVVSNEVGAAPDLAMPGVCVTVAAGDHAGFAQALESVFSPREDDCLRAVSRCTFDAATNGLVVAATFASQNVRGTIDRPASRVIALCGNLVVPGGMERITFEALSALRRGGADVHVLVNSWSSRPIAELAERAGATWQVGHYDARLDGVLTNPGRLARALRDVVMASAQVGRLVWQRQTKHVLAVDFRAVLLHAPALVLCRLMRIQVLLRSGVPPTRTRLHEWLWSGIIRPLVTRHIANSEFTAGELRAVGIPADRLTIIHNIAPARERIETIADRDPRRIAYVGQIIPEKGVRQLLDAAGLLVGRGYDVRLDVAGHVTGWAPASVLAYRQELRARAEQPDLAGRVRFLGWREDIDAVLQRASLHCCPSQPEQREGFGITVVEAKRAAVPSVVCPSGALPELIAHQRDGWIASGFDAESIAAGLEWFLADERRMAAAQEAALDSARRFDPALFERLWQEELGLLSRRAVHGGRRALARVEGTLP
jgi:glycosyltransferase involved in cell wall biosynthesis